MTQDTIQGLPIRLDGQRLIYTGGESGLAELGFGRPIDMPLVREDVAQGMLPTVRKPSVARGFDLMEEVWPKSENAPCLGRLEAEVLRQNARVLRAAQSAVAAHNDLLSIFASVAAVSRRAFPDDDTLATELNVLWHKATSVRSPRTVTSLMDADRVGNGSGVRKAFRKLTVSLRRVHDSFVDAARAAVLDALDRRDAVLGTGAAGSTASGEGRDALGAELVAGRFVHQITTDLNASPAGPPKRLAFRDLWTWPLNETDRHRVLLGLVAMRVLENTSGDQERWFTAEWGNRRPFEFWHTTSGQAQTVGGLLVVKSQWAAPSAKLMDVLDSLAVLWRWYTGTTVDDDSANDTATMLRDYLTKALRITTSGGGGSRAQHLLAVLRQAEINLGFEDKRYDPAYRHQQALAPFLPVIVAVAVEYERAHSRL